MVGYILGLGDRHIHNILIDKYSAELVHIGKLRTIFILECIFVNYLFRSWHCFRAGQNIAHARNCTVQTDQRHH